MKEVSKSAFLRETTKLLSVPWEKKNDVEIFFPRMSTLSYNLL